MVIKSALVKVLLDMDENLASPGVDKWGDVDYLFLLPAQTGCRKVYHFKEEYIMGRHKKHERAKELDRKRQRRKKAIKAAIKEAKEAK